jgi:hypothetical protein
LDTACVDAVQAVAYLNYYDTNNVCLDYLADTGYSPPILNSFSFQVPAGATFVVVVNESYGGSGCPAYKLIVSGLPCPRPVVAIDPLPNKVRLHWPTWAGGYLLDASTNAALTSWNVVTNEPIAAGGSLTVTNNTPAPPTKFYRLRKPQ